MHNNYIKELAVKSYQEDLQKEFTALRNGRGIFRVLSLELW